MLHELVGGSNGVLRVCTEADGKNCVCVWDVPLISDVYMYARI